MAPKKQTPSNTSVAAQADGARHGPVAHYVVPEDGNEDECGACHGAGELICCEGCVAAYHSECAGYGETLHSDKEAPTSQLLPKPVSKPLPYRSPFYLLATTFKLLRLFGFHHPHLPTQASFSHVVVALAQREFFSGMD
jgi:hypothetical protein